MSDIKHAPRTKEFSHTQAGGSIQAWHDFSELLETELIECKVKLEEARNARNRSALEVRKELMGLVKRANERGDYWTNEAAEILEKLTKMEKRRDEAIRILQTAIDKFECVNFGYDGDCGSNKIMEDADSDLDKLKKEIEA